MSHVKQQQERRHTSCLATADALLDALAKGDVSPGEAMHEMPEHLMIDAVAFPEKEHGVHKMLSASALMLDAVKNQLPDKGVSPQAGYKNIDGKTYCWIEDFDRSALRVNEAKAYMRQVIKNVVKEMPDPVKKYDGDTSVDTDAYWMGPFRPQQMPYVDAIMATLLSFHNVEGLESQTFDLHDGTLAVKCNAHEIQALLRKEGMVAQPQQPSH